MSHAHPWCLYRVSGRHGAGLIVDILDGPGRPDLGTVDEFARLQLLAGRLGGKLEILQICPELVYLLELSGLGIQMEGQTELWEQPTRIQQGQKEGHLGDLPP
jgi:hypothetical protein